MYTRDRTTFNLSMYVCIYVYVHKAIHDIQFDLDLECGFGWLGFLCSDQFVLSTLRHGHSLFDFWISREIFPSLFSVYHLSLKVLAVDTRVGKEQ